MCQGLEVGIWNWGHKEAGGRDSKISVTRSEGAGEGRSVWWVFFLLLIKKMKTPKNRAYCKNASV